MLILLCASLNPLCPARGLLEMLPSGVVMGKGPGCLGEAQRLAVGGLAGEGEQVGG